MKKTVAVLISGSFVLTLALATVGAQGTKSANDGVYTAEQAKRGEVLYKEQCAGCHGDNLEGSGPMPALAGADFLAAWSTRTVGDLFEKTHTTMPATAPGSLTPEQAADITAYMLAASKYPAGTTALETKIEALSQIKIDKPAQDKPAQ